MVCREAVPDCWALTVHSAAARGDAVSRMSASDQCGEWSGVSTGDRRSHRVWRWVSLGVVACRAIDAPHDHRV